MVSQSPAARSATRSRLPHAFADQPRVAQVVAAVVIPALLGAVAGLVLGVSGVGYWAIQVIATIGGFLAGLEHDGARSGALRGVVGGFAFGALILAVRALTGWSDEASLGDVPALLVVVTTVAGTILGTLGGVTRARVLRR